MLTIIICWIALFTIISSIGYLILNKRTLSFLHLSEKVEWFEYFWIGLVAVFVLIQIWSIFLPVNGAAFLFVLFLSLIAFLILLRTQHPLSKLWKTIFKIFSNNIHFFFICLIILFIFSYFASQPVGWYDTLLYHLNFVKWGKTFAVVPGLANLHTRLGLNSSFFLFASMIDNWFLKDRSSHVALSLIVSVLSIEYLWISLKLKKGIIKIFSLLTLPLIVAGVIKSGQMASLSPDFVLVIIVLALSIEFIRGDDKSLFIAGVLALLLPTIKLSGAPFSLLIILFIFGNFLIRKKENRFGWRRMFVLTVVGVFLLSGYLVRNVFLSGWLFYPAPLGKINVPWAMSKENVKTFSLVIQGWARLPGKNWNSSLSKEFWDWFPVWFKTNSGQPEIIIFFSTFVISFFYSLKRIINKVGRKITVRLAALGLFSFLSIIYVVFTAPDMRFLVIYIWTFFASAVSLGLCLIFEKNQYLNSIALTLSIILTILVAWPPKIEAKPIFRTIRWETTFQTKEVVIRAENSKLELKIVQPTVLDLCGNSELLCTPEIGKIEERVPGDISKGFILLN